MHDRQARFESAPLLDRRTQFRHFIERRRQQSLADEVVEERRARRVELAVLPAVDRPAERRGIGACDRRQLLRSGRCRRLDGRIAQSARQAASDQSRFRLTGVASDHLGDAEPRATCFVPRADRQIPLGRDLDVDLFSLPVPHVPANPGRFVALRIGPHVEQTDHARIVLHDEADSRAVATADGDPEFVEVDGEGR